MEKGGLRQFDSGSLWELKREQKELLILHIILKSNFSFIFINYIVQYLESKRLLISNSISPRLLTYPGTEGQMY